MPTTTRRPPQLSTRHTLRSHIMFYIRLHLKTLADSTFIISDIFLYTMVITPLLIWFFCLMLGTKYALAQEAIWAWKDLGQTVFGLVAGLRHFVRPSREPEASGSSKYIPVLLELGSTRQVLRLLAHTLIALGTDVSFKEEVPTETRNVLRVHTSNDPASSGDANTEHLNQGASDMQAASATQAGPPPAQEPNPTTLSHIRDYSLTHKLPSGDRTVATSPDRTVATFPDRTVATSPPYVSRRDYAFSRTPSSVSPQFDLTEERGTHRIRRYLEASHPSAAAPVPSTVDSSPQREEHETASHPSVANSPTTPIPLQPSLSNVPCTQSHDDEPIHSVSSRNRTTSDDAMEDASMGPAPSFALSDRRSYTSQETVNMLLGKSIKDFDFRSASLPHRAPSPPSPFSSSIQRQSMVSLPETRNRALSGLAEPSHLVRERAVPFIQRTSQPQDQANNMPGPKVAGDGHFEHQTGTRDSDSRNQAHQLVNESATGSYGSQEERDSQEALVSRSGSEIGELEQALLPLGATGFAPPATAHSQSAQLHQSGANPMDKSSETVAPPDVIISSDTLCHTTMIQHFSIVKEWSMAEVKSRLDEGRDNLREGCTESALYQAIEARWGSLEEEEQTVLLDWLDWLLKYSEILSKRPIQE